MLRQLGNELREAREKRGISIADAQAETKIRSRYLEALEQGQFSILPGVVYAKGFLKSYAEFLGLDGRAMVERFKQWQDEQEAAQAPTVGTAAANAPRAEKQAAAPPKQATPTRLEPAKVTPAKGAPAAPTPAGAALKKSNSFLQVQYTTWAALGVLLVVGIIVGGWIAWRGSGPAQGSPGPNPGVEQPGGQSGSGPATGSNTNGTTGQGTQPGQSGGITLQPGTPPDAYTIPFTIGGAAAGKALKLTVVARDSCWIRLERAGADPVEETLTAGATRVWEFTGEARIKVGNPPGVSVKVDETALPEATYVYPVTYVFTRS